MQSRRRAQTRAARTEPAVRMRQEARSRVWTAAVRVGGESLHCGVVDLLSLLLPLGTRLSLRPASLVERNLCADALEEGLELLGLVLGRTLLERLGERLDKLLCLPSARCERSVSARTDLVVSS